jgi:hypothetical protein
MEPQTVEHRCHACQAVATTPIEWDGDLYCQTCIDDTSLCMRCDRRAWQQDLNSINQGDSYYCESCTDERCRWCDRCDTYVMDDDFVDSEDMCVGCLNDDDNYIESPHSRRRVNVESTVLQGEDKGKIVTHKRKFGIELECLFTKTDTLQKVGSEIQRAWGISDDGSIRPSKNSIGTAELISPIMQGKKGEDEIKKLCKIAYPAGLIVNKSCGYHLHLDVAEFKRDKKDDQVVSERNVWFILDSRYGHHVSSYDYDPTEELKSELRSQPHLKIEKKTLPNLILNTGRPFQRLRDLWYAYLAFDDVFRAMQPQSRRNNTFCRASSSLYSLERVRELEDYTELEALWYRIDKRIKMERQQAEVESRKQYKDSSRYTGFNLEPLLRNGSHSVEFRYHSPTLNAEKILRWIDIHQSIVDKVSNGELDDGLINNTLAVETNVIKRAMFMCDFFGIKKATKEYILERIKKFNVVEESVEDEEVEDAEEGTPHTRIVLPTIRRGLNRAPRTYGQMLARQIRADTDITRIPPVNSATEEAGQSNWDELISLI